MPARIEPGMKRTSVSSRTTKESQLPEQPLRSQSHSVIHSSSEEWIKIRLMDLADSPYSTSSQKISALEYLGKNLGMF